MQVALPMPLAPPVTTMVLPLKDESSLAVIFGSKDMAA